MDYRVAAGPRLSADPLDGSIGLELHVLDLTQRHLQEAGAELAERIHLAGAQEAVLALGVALRLEALRLEHPLGGGGHGVARR